MLKEVFNFSKKTAKKHLNVSQWANFQGVSESADWIASLLRRVFDVAPPKHSETFEEAKKRLRLTEAALHQRVKFFRWMTWMYMTCFLALLIYGYCYLYKSSQSIVILLVVFCVALLVLSQAFRYSYWHCQIVKRQLGCTLKTWFKWLIKASV